MLFLMFHTNLNTHPRLLYLAFHFTCTLHPLTRRVSPGSMPCYKLSLLLNHSRSSPVFRPILFHVPALSSPLAIVLVQILVLDSLSPPPSRRLVLSFSARACA